MRLSATATLILATVLTIAGLVAFTYSFWGDVLGISITILGVVAAGIVALAYGFHSLLRAELAKKRNEDPGLILPISVLSCIGLGLAAILGLTGVLSPMACSALALVATAIYPANFIGLFIGALAMGPQFTPDEHLAD